MAVDNNDNDVIGDINLSENKSDIWIAVTSLIFSLEYRSKAQNVANLISYLVPVKRIVLKMAAILKISKYSRFILTSDMKRPLQIFT